MDKGMQDKLNNLRQWVGSLSHVVNDILPQIEETLNGKSKLSKGCPSKESMAALELRQIEKKLSEVVAAVDDVKKALLR